MLKCPAKQKSSYVSEQLTKFQLFTNYKSIVTMNTLFTVILYYVVKNQKTTSTTFKLVGISKSRVLKYKDKYYPIKLSDDRLRDFPTSLANMKCASNTKGAPKQLGY